ncbi:MAG: Uma2 family endonuclease [Gemmataceae bacterium]|nr:Uma2 family endonuclease [Gemmataceae bacterium]
MSAALKRNLISVDDYLAGELLSPIKHEYLGGVVHAMAGARVGHYQVATNTLISLGGQLRGKRCRAYGSDMKIRVIVHGQVWFYYPDVSVICNSNPSNELFQDQPVVIIEVLSKSTRRIDLGEKKDAYLTIASLQAYVLIEQELPLAVVFRRTDGGFVREVYEGLDAVIALPEIDTKLALADVYEGVEFVPEPDDEE